MPLSKSYSTSHAAMKIIPFISLVIGIAAVSAEVTTTIQCPTPQPNQYVSAIHCVDDAGGVREYESGLSCKSTFMTIRSTGPNFQEDMEASLRKQHAITLCEHSILECGKDGILKRSCCGDLNLSEGLFNRYEQQQVQQAPWDKEEYSELFSSEGAEKSQEVQDEKKRMEGEDRSGEDVTKEEDYLGFDGEELGDVKSKFQTDGGEEKILAGEEDNAEQDEEQIVFQNRLQTDEAGEHDLVDDYAGEEDYLGEEKYAEDMQGGEEMVFQNRLQTEESGEYDQEEDHVGEESHVSEEDYMGNEPSEEGINFQNRLQAEEGEEKATEEDYGEQPFEEVEQIEEEPGIQNKFQTEGAGEYDGEEGHASEDDYTTYEQIEEELGFRNRLQTEGEAYVEEDGHGVEEEYVGDGQGDGDFATEFQNKLQTESEELSPEEEEYDQSEGEEHN